MKKFNNKYLSIIVVLILMSCKEKTNNKIIKDVTTENVSLEKNDCEKGTKRAISDFNNGKYKLFSYGEIAYDDWDFQNFYEHFVREKYNIEIGNAGCVVYPDTECYSIKMQELVFEKFGNNVLINAKKIAKNEYENYKKNKFNDSKAEFIGGNDKLSAYLKEKIENRNNFKGKILVKFTVEKNGNISDVTIKRKKNIDSIFPIDNEIIKIFQNMPKWKPETFNNKKISSSQIVPIIIN